jgi:hypothetical protein
VNREAQGVVPAYVDGFGGFPPITQFPRPCLQSSVATFNEAGASSTVLGTPRNFVSNTSTSAIVGVANQPAAAPEMANGMGWMYRAGPVPVPLYIEVDTASTFAGPQRHGRVVGLPWTGVAFRTAINANAQPGLLASYGSSLTIYRRRVLTINPPAPAGDAGQQR